MKMTINRNNRTFIAHVSPEGSGMVSVAFHEVVRPTWKIFRATIFPIENSWFYLKDYPSIEVGINHRLTHVLRAEEERNENMKKWQDFEKSIDK